MICLVRFIKYRRIYWLQGWVQYIGLLLGYGLCVLWMSLAWESKRFRIICIALELPLYFCKRSKTHILSDLSNCSESDPCTCRTVLMHEIIFLSVCVTCLTTEFERSGNRYAYSSNVAFNQITG